ncbi:hypothetical protein TNCV_3251891 [Trichonephila clavipes]|nr:hypothetical protein TNCV_3251891 [Trichonephila clavipes]
MHYSATRWLLAMDLIILNHGQGRRKTPELALLSPNYRTTPTGVPINEHVILTQPFTGVIRRPKQQYCTSGVPYYTRAFGDGPRHSEPWSSDEDDT